MKLGMALMVALSTPTFDLNAYPLERTRLLADRANLPLMNRGYAAAYPPGSVVKLANSSSKR